MGRARESAEISALAAPVDLAARVIYFPVRHHSPACAWHVRRLIAEVRPTAVLIEGPRDATPLLPLLLDPETRMPVAIYTTYVQPTAITGLPARHAAYYPLCDFSPELAAAKAGAEVGAVVKFIDLTFPEKVEAGEEETEEAPNTERSRPQSLQDEKEFSHSRLLQAACIRTGARDHDDLWDHLYEIDYQHRSTADFMRNVLGYCRLARKDQSLEKLRRDGTLAREEAMAAAIEEHASGRVIVVTGGFHTVALPETKGKLPQPLKIAPEDHQLVLMRYSFEQLDRLNGYASGMPAPEFYQRIWEGESTSRLLVEIARQCRKKNLGVSTADAIAALSQAQRLASLRQHASVSREDLMDAVRSVFIKGSDDAEGVPVLAIARKLLAGARVGNVPAHAGQPPIVHDFRHTAQELKIKLDKLSGTEIALDLYRKSTHRDISRLFHRLSFLQVPFATFQRGPDFVRGANLERIQEVWSYTWSPQTESTLIERSLYGSTIEEAASNMLLERFQSAESDGKGRQAGLATELVVHACRMGLHKHTQELLNRLGELIAGDQEFSSLVTAIENLLALEVSREPLEAHHLSGVHELAVAAYTRGCYLLPQLASVPSEEENRALESLNAFYQAAQSLGDEADLDLKPLRVEALRNLLITTGGSAALRGGAAGLLHGDGELPGDELTRHLRGHLLSSREGGIDGPNFLRGLLKTSRDVLWQVEDCLAALHEALHGWDEDQFIKLLPLLRLALADLTPRETDAVAKRVAALVGAEHLKVTVIADMDASEMLRAVEVNRLVRAALAADGLEVLGE